MRRTFNVGIGMMVAVAEENAEKAIALLEAEGETVFRMGRISQTEGSEASETVEFID